VPRVGHFELHEAFLPRVNRARKALPNAGEVAYCRDPEGNVFALLKSLYPSPADLPAAGAPQRAGSPFPMRAPGALSERSAMLEHPDTLQRLAAARHGELLAEAQRARASKHRLALWDGGLQRCGEALTMLGARLKRRPAPAIRVSTRHYPYPPFDKGSARNRL